MAVLGLCFYVRAFSSCGERGPLFIAVRGPLTIAASLAVEHRLQTRRLSNCGWRAQLLRGMWDPPRPGLEPVSPALAGRVSTTAPPGKLERVALFRRCPVMPSGAVLRGHRSQVPREYLPCELCVPSFGGWTVLAAGPLMGGTGPSVTSCEAQLWLLQVYWYAELAPQSGSCFGGALGQPRSPAGWGGLGATLENLARVCGWAGLAFGEYWAGTWCWLGWLRVTEMVPASTCQVGGRRVKKKKNCTRQHFYSQRKLHQIPAPPAHTLILVNESSCLMT